MNIYNCVHESLEHQEFPPNGTIKLNEDKDIRIDINTPHIKTLPWRSEIVHTGQLKLLDKDGKAVKIDFTKFKLTNLFIAHLYKRVIFYISDTEVDKVDHVGVTAVIHALASIVSPTKYSNAGWNLNNEKHLMINDKGQFKVAIPLELLLGFFNSFRNVLFNVSQSLEIQIDQHGVTNMVVLDPSLNGYTVQLDTKSITWRMPVVKFADKYDNVITDAISTDRPLSLCFDHWKTVKINNVSGKEDKKTIATDNIPFYAFVVFQVKRDNNLFADKSKFDHCNAYDVRIVINGDEYPRQQMRLNLNDKDYGMLYTSFKNYAGKDHVIIDNNQFETDYTIFTYDLTGIPSITTELADVQMHFTWRDDFPAAGDIYVFLKQNANFEYKPITRNVRRAI